MRRRETLACRRRVALGIGGAVAAPPLSGRLGDGSALG
jgi:hypothetical protein